MRILCVNHTSYADEITGAEKSLYYDVRCLVQRGFDVAVLSRKPGRSTQLFRGLKIPVHVVPYDAPRVKTIMERFNPDLVYVNTIGPVAVAETARSLRMPVMWVVREIPVDHVERLKSLDKHATVIVAISRAVERNLGAHGVKGRIERLPNAVDLEELNEEVWADNRAERRKKHNLSSSRVVIGFVGKVSEKKGIADFIDMAIRVGKRKRKATFFVFGHVRPPTRPLITRLRLRLARAKMGKRVFFLGFSQDIRRIYPALDIVVVPSLADEPFGRVTVEAMAFRKPVVAYDSGASREIVVHGETGFVVPKGDVRQLSKAVLELFDRTKRLQFGDAGRARVESHFSMPAHAEKLVKLIHRYGRSADTDGKKVRT